MTNGQDALQTGNLAAAILWFEAASTRLICTMACILPQFRMYNSHIIIESAAPCTATPPSCGSKRQVALSCPVLSYPVLPCGSKRQVALPSSVALHLPILFTILFSLRFAVNYDVSDLFILSRRCFFPLSLPLRFYRSRVLTHRRVACARSCRRCKVICSAPMGGSSSA